MKNFNFELKDGTTKTMEFDELVRWSCLFRRNFYELVRWSCLIEALEVVGSQEAINIDSDKWIKPLAFQKYIDERYHSMKHDLTVEASLGNL